MADTLPSHSPRYLPTYDKCFVCGSQHPRGLHLRFFTRGDGIAYVEFTPEDSLTGYDDIVHGGILATVFDELLGWSVGIRTGQLFMTGELTVPLFASGTLEPDLSVQRTSCGGEETLLDRRRRHARRGRKRIRAGGGQILPSWRAKRTREVATQLNYQPDDLPVFLDEVN